MKRIDKLMILLVLVFLYEIVTSSLGSRSSEAVSPAETPIKNTIVKEQEEELVTDSIEIYDENLIPDEQTYAERTGEVWEGPTDLEMD